MDLVNLMEYQWKINLNEVIIQQFCNIQCLKLNTYKLFKKYFVVTWP